MLRKIGILYTCDMDMLIFYLNKDNQSIDDHCMVLDDDFCNQIFKNDHNKTGVSTIDSTQKDLSGAEYDMALLGNASYTSCTTDRRRGSRLLQGGGLGPSGCNPTETTHTRQYYPVNGQLEPMIDDTHSNGKWYLDEWRIFRLIGAQMEYLFQFYFDTYNSKC